MAYYDWPTNDFDFKPQWPPYIKNFSSKYTEDEKRNEYYRKIWN